MPTQVDAENFRLAIRRLRQKLGIKANYEFKYSHTSATHKIRSEFFAEALATSFRFAAHHIEKTAQHSQTHIYWECATVLAVSLRTLYDSAEEARPNPLREPIIVDNNDDREYLNIIKRQFRGLKSKRTRSSLIGKVAFRDSRSDEMIQLADMVCGAAADHDDRTWYEVIAERNATV